MELDLLLSVAVGALLTTSFLASLRLGSRMTKFLEKRATSKPVFMSEISREIEQLRKQIETTLPVKKGLVSQPFVSSLTRSELWVLEAKILYSMAESFRILGQHDESLKLLKEALKMVRTAIHELPDHVNDHVFLLNARDVLDSLESSLRKEKKEEK